MPPTFAETNRRKLLTEYQFILLGVEAKLGKMFDRMSGSSHRPGNEAAPPMVELESSGEGIFGPVAGPT